MKIENQVSSLELSKKLKELGMKQDSLFAWVEILEKGETLNSHIFNKEWEKPEYYAFVVGDLVKGVYSALTVAELGELLRKVETKIVTTWFAGKKIYKIRRINGMNYFEADTEADARAKMLVYLLENKLTS